MENNVKYFYSEDGFHQFVLRQIKKEIGEGSEGTVYLTKNNEALKEMYCTIHQYPNDNILMEPDVKLDSFLFPKELYVIGKDIHGYKTDYFPNIFKMGDGYIRDIDIDALIRAGHKMISDIEVLTKMNYILYDLPYNILFDGTSLKAIDTLQYYKRDDITLEKNISILRDALVTAIKLHDEYCSAKSQNQMIRKLTKSFE